MSINEEKITCDDIMDEGIEPGEDFVVSPKDSMNIVELSEYRKQLFQIIDQKMGEIYYVTRSKKNIEEIRGYVFALLSFAREYFVAHQNHFQLRKRYINNGIYGSHVDHPLECASASHFSKHFYGNDLDKKLTTQDVQSIRKYFVWLFSEIIEIHALLEGKDQWTEKTKRLMYIRGFPYLQPRTGQRFKSIKAGTKQSTGGRIGGGSIGDRIDVWSGKFNAKYTYQCDRCPFNIEKGESYEKEVIRMGEGVEILRYHTLCPEDPDDPMRYRNEDELATNISIDKAA